MHSNQFLLVVEKTACSGSCGRRDVCVCGGCLCVCV